MREVACNFCFSDETSLVLKGPDRLHGVSGEFKLVQCQNCGLIYQNPQPTREELRTYYPDHYEPYVGTRRDHLRWLRTLDYRYGVEKRYRAIMKYFREPGRMLDVGCSNGAFLEGMREHEWDVMGIEPNDRAAAYARGELRLDVLNKDFESVRLEDESLDLVTMWNVLEHLSDPLRALKKIRCALREDGMLVFAIPSLESYDLRVFRAYWSGYDLPRHLYVFPRRALEKALNKVGFSISERRNLYGTYSALASSAKFYLNDHIEHEWLRALLIKGLFSLPLRVLLMPLGRWVDARKCGTIMTWFCRRI